jgi:N-acetylglucosamine-6-sulfatase
MRGIAIDRRVRLTLALCGAVLIAACGKLGSGAERSSAQAPAAPNVLLIVTDDQPAGTTKRMPKLTKAPGFVRFSSYYDNNPLCCPTRATLLTGLYSHHHGVGTNLVASQFDDSETLATWLDAAGYDTGLFGKYLNTYPWSRGRNYVPPGWDEWSAFTPDAAYYDYTLVTDDGRRRYGSRPRDYSTDVLADQVDGFIRSADDPYFAYFAPYAPHAPRTPAPRDRHAFAGAKVKLPPNFNRVAAGAPKYWRERPKLDPAEEKRATKDQWRSLLAVDDAIGRFLKTIAGQGETANTVVIFVSDNGYSLGAHRAPFKDCAYEECIQLPLWIRWPGVTDPGGGENGALVGSMDIAPTIAEIAGAAPTLPADGHSLGPLLRGEAGSVDRPGILLRHVQYPKVAPSFWGLRTERWTYAVYDKSREVELYDNDADPHQLRNLAGRADSAEIEQDLAAKLEQLRSE